MSLVLSSLSTEYVRVRVIAYKAGVAVNPTADTVQLAFPTSGVSPVSGDWKAGSWETTPDGQYLARCLIGPTGGVIALTPGKYDIWVKVTDAPEIPVIESGRLTIQ